MGKKSSHGGQRTGSGRKPSWENTEVKRVGIPRDWANDKDRLREIWNFLNANNHDLRWLLSILQSQEIRIHHLPTDRTPKPLSSLYRKFSTSVAASFASRLISDVEAGGYEEVDIVQELTDYAEVADLWTVDGDSMIDDGINPGDTLIVHPIQYPFEQPKDMDVVVARVGEYLTVKRFRNTNADPRLEPRNSQKNYSCIQLGENDHVYGIVKKIVSTP